MRVATWNVQTGRPNPDGPRDLDRTAAHLRSLDADVWALQELDRGRRRSDGADQPTTLALALDATLVWAPTVHGGGQYGIALIVRGDVVRSYDVGLSGTREPRTLLVAEIDHGGRRWTIGCTHLSRRRRFAQGQLQTCLEVLARHRAPRVLVGDLNLGPRHVLPWSTAAGFQFVEGPLTHSTRQRRLTERIDHVLVSGATVGAAAVHRFDISDHCAVTADLS